MATEHDTPTQPTAEDAAAVDAAKTAAETKPDLEAEAVKAALGDEAATEDQEDGAKPPEPAKKDDAAPGAPKDEAKPDEPGKAPPEAAKNPLDEEDDPKEYKGRTAERVKALREAGRAERAGREEAEQKLAEALPDVDRWRQWQGVIVDSGAAVEDLGMSMSVIRAVVKGNPQEKQIALNVVNELRQTLADQLGVTLDGVDYLKDYDDLRRQVEEGELTEKNAREIATMRRNRARTEADNRDAEARRNQAKAETDTAEQQQAVITKAHEDIRAAGEAFLARDGQKVFDIRSGYATRQIKALRDNGTVFDPAKAAGVFKAIYESEDAALLVQAATAPARSATGTRPIMGNRQGVAGGTQHEPASEEDAILAALRT